MIFSLSSLSGIFLGLVSRIFLVSQHPHLGNALHRFQKDFFTGFKRTYPRGASSLRNGWISGPPALFQIFVLTFWKSQCFEMMRWVEARLPGVLHFGRGTWLVGTWLVGNLTSWDVLTLLDRTGPSPIHHCWLCTSWHVPLTAEFYIKLTCKAWMGRVNKVLAPTLHTTGTMGVRSGSVRKRQSRSRHYSTSLEKVQKKVWSLPNPWHFAICKNFTMFTTCNRAPHPKGGERLLGENSLLAI